MLAAVTGRREEAQVRAAVDRVSGRVSGALPEGVVEATVRECFADLSGARIRDFVPVLAERRAEERLRPPAQRPTGVPGRT